MSLDFVLISALVGLTVFHIGTVRRHRFGHSQWRKIALQHSDRIKGMEQERQTQDRKLEKMTKIVVTQNKQITDLVRQVESLSAPKEGNRIDE